MTARAASAVGDSRQSLTSTYLSAALLAGLLPNSILWWAWADSAAALVIAVFAVREGIEAWRGDACCAAPVSALTGDRAKRSPCEKATVRRANVREGDRSKFQSPASK